MVSELGELIARYEAAQIRVMEVVQSRPDSDIELNRADQELSSAFNAVLEHQTDTPEESVQRVRFLLDQIKSIQSGNEMVERLADRVWLDLMASDGIADHGSQDQTEKLTSQG